MTQTALSVRNLNFSYNTKKVLNGISFDIQENSYISIIGPNGAGKSTLLKCINRIVEGAEGDIHILSKNLALYSQKELGRIVGYVPQAHEHTYPYSVYEFVLMGRFPHLNPLSRISKKDKNIVEHAMEITGIQDLSNRKISQLSGGERQKVYLASSLAQEPKILLLDEPKTHLDPKHQIEIQKTISTVSSQLNITVLHITHDLNYIKHWSDKVIALKEGRIVFNDSTDKVINVSNLHKIYEAQFSLFECKQTKKIIIAPQLSL